jgi:hypothetical protein
MTRAVQLTARPEGTRYDVKKDGRAEAKLKAELERRYKHTEIRVISRPEDLLLGPRAGVDSLSPEYRLTTPALGQICTRLAPGLSTALYSIAGATGDPDKTGGSDPRLAINMLNQVIKLRYGKLDGFSLVVDHDKKLVEGLVGRKYEYFPNLDLFERVKKFTAEADSPAEFCEASIYGRKLVVRFRCDDELFSIPKNRKTDEPFFGGYHFTNAETGDCSIRASAVIIRQWCDNKCISDFTEGGCMPHIRGARFEKRFCELLDRVRVKAEESTKFKPRVLELMDQKLGLGGDQDDHKDRMKELGKQLQKQSLTNDFAKESLRHTMKYGSYRTDILNTHRDAMEVYAKRTAYDLFNALTHRAKDKSVETQERAEQVAYRMLTGKFSIN